MRLVLVLLSHLYLCAWQGVQGTVAAGGSAFQARPRALLPPTTTRTCLQDADGSGSASVATLPRLRGGAVDAGEIVAKSYDWLMNLGSPAALVAGAVVASLYEFNRNDTLELERKDTKLVKFAKKCSKMLLVWAFALELLSIFVVMVMGTGTWLL